MWKSWILSSINMTSVYRAMNIVGSLLLLRQQRLGLARIALHIARDAREEQQELFSPLLGHLRRGRAQHLGKEVGGLAVGLQEDLDLMADGRLAVFVLADAVPQHRDRFD